MSSQNLDELVKLNDAFEKLPSPQFAQVITFEGSDYFIIAPEDYDAFHLVFSEFMESKS